MLSYRLVNTSIKISQLTPEVTSLQVNSGPVSERKLHSRQDEKGKPTPGKAAAGKKQDFAALMAARQKKMREAEEADEGMYFD